MRRPLRRRPHLVQLPTYHQYCSLTISLSTTSTWFSNTPREGDNYPLDSLFQCLTAFPNNQPQNSMENFKHDLRKKWTCGQGWIKEWLHDAWSDAYSKQAGTSQRPYPWLSSVYTTTVRSRGHVLLLHIMLRRDAQTDFIKVEVMYMYLTAADWYAVLINHASTQAQKKYTYWKHLRIFYQNFTCKKTKQNLYCTFREDFWRGHFLVFKMLA